MYSYEKCICSKCGTEHQKDQCYINKETDEIFCLVCITKVKKEREITNYKRSTLYGREYYKKNKRKYTKRKEDV